MRIRDLCVRTLGLIDNFTSPRSITFSGTVGFIKEPVDVHGIEGATPFDKKRTSLMTNNDKGSCGEVSRQSTDIVIVAIIAAHNEDDVIYDVIGDLIKQGIQVYFIDHCSTDNTVQEASKWIGKGLMHIERFPEDAGYPLENKTSYIWRDILKRKEELALSLDADWFIHHDADEFRESPWPDLTLYEAIKTVHESWI